MLAIYPLRCQVAEESADSKSIEDPGEDTASLFEDIILATRNSVPLQRVDFSRDEGSYQAVVLGNGL
jgi:hypothetical protein